MWNRCFWAVWQSDSETFSGCESNLSLLPPVSPVSLQLLLRVSLHGSRSQTIHLSTLSCPLQSHSAAAPLPLFSTRSKSTSFSEWCQFQIEWWRSRDLGFCGFFGRQLVPSRGRWFPEGALAICCSGHLLAAAASDGWQKLQQWFKKVLKISW